VLEVVDRAARRIQQLGFFGPLGIDVMQYRTHDGELCWRPLQDINARLTMGRAALGLRRLLTSDEQADWLHLRASSAAGGGSGMPGLAEVVPPGARVIRTSPLEAASRPNSHPTALVISRSREVLDKFFATVRTVHGRYPRCYD
jgi:hypothetical protein